MILKIIFMYKINLKYAFEKYMYEGDESIKPRNLITLSRIEYSSIMKEQLERIHKNKKSFLNL